MGNSFLSSSIGDSIEDVISIAVDVVKATERISEFTGPQKREEAFKRIFVRTKSQGKEVAKHVIYVAIELAICAIRD